MAKNKFFLNIAMAVLLVGLIQPAPARGQETAGHEVLSLSLAEAIQTAFKDNRQVLISRETIKISKARILGAQGRFLPHANLNAGYLHRDAVMKLNSLSANTSGKDIGMFVGFENENRAALNLNQAVFSGGRNTAYLSQAKLDLKAQEQSLRAQELAIEFEVRRLYYGLLLAQETTRIAQDLLDQARAHLDEVNASFRQGTVSKFDTLQSKVQVSKIMPQVVRAKNAEDLIAAELADALGMEADQKIQLKDKLTHSPVKVNEEEFLQQAQWNRPELIMKTLGIDMSRYQIDIERSAALPQVNLDANYEYRSNDPGDMFNSSHNAWNAGIQVSMPLFDGFSAKAKVDEARARYSQAKIEKQDLDQKIALDIRRACLDLNQAETIIQSQQDSVEEAKEALRISRVSYNNGVGTNLDVLDAQVSLSQIENNLAQAVYDHQAAYAFLDKSRGWSVLADSGERRADR